MAAVLVLLSAPHPAPLRDSCSSLLAALRGRSDLPSRSSSSKRPFFGAARLLSAGLLLLAPLRDVLLRAVRRAMPSGQMPVGIKARLIVVAKVGCGPLRPVPRRHSRVLDKLFPRHRTATGEGL